jgi:hypothetical protein
VARPDGHPPGDRPGDTPGARLGRILASTALVLEAEFLKSADALEHRGLRGTAREIPLVRDFFSKLFPSQFSYACGEVISSDGSRSGQQDVIIYHGTRTPVLFQSESIALVPVEGVLGVVEVKSMLDGRELESAIEQVSTVKRLRRTAYHEQHLNVEFKKDRPPSEILGYVFAYRSIDLAELARRIKEKTEADSPAIDGVFVLDKGIIIHTSPESGKPLPAWSQGTILRADTKSSPLLTMYTLLWSALMRAWTPPIRVSDYFGH